MATVFDVAKYVLKKLGDTTTMKLQKIVYYCQAWALAWDDKPLFPEDFQAWAHGPVCPELYHWHQGLFVVDVSMLSNLPDYPFTASEQETMDKVLEYYGDKEPQWLSELTHMQNPWRDARSGVDRGEPCEQVISKESMQQYYGGL